MATAILNSSAVWRGLETNFTELVFGVGTGPESLRVLSLKWEIKSSLPCLPIDHSQARCGTVQYDCERNDRNYQRLLGKGLVIKYKTDT